MIKDAIEDSDCLERTQSSIDLYLDGWCCSEERKGGVMNNFKITPIDHPTWDGYRLNAKGISYCVWKDQNSAMYLFVQDMEQRLAENDKLRAALAAAREIVETIIDEPQDPIVISFATLWLEKTRSI